MRFRQFHRVYYLCRRNASPTKNCNLRVAMKRFVVNSLCIITLCFTSGLYAMPRIQSLGTLNDSTQLWRHGDTTLSTRSNGLMIQIGNGGASGYKTFELSQSEFSSYTKRTNGDTAAAIRLMNTEFDSLMEECSGVLLKGQKLLTKGMGTLQKGLAQLEPGFDELEQSIAQLGQTLTDFSSEVAELNQQGQEKDQNALADELRAFEHDMQEFSKDMQALVQEKKALKTEQRRSLNEIAQAQKDIKKARAEIAQSRKEIARASAKIQQARKELGKEQ